MQNEKKTINIRLIEKKFIPSTLRAKYCDLVISLTALKQGVVHEVL